MDIQQDPNFEPGPPVLEEIRVIRRERFTAQCLGAIAGAALLSPLKTMAVLLQLSVQPHADLYGTKREMSDSLAKLNTDLTPREKARYELLVRKGGDPTQRAFQAPVYQNLRGVWQDLVSQGFRAFYKGLNFRLLKAGISSGLKLQLACDLLSQEPSRANWCLKLLIYSGVEVLTNILSVGEHRFILQNALPNFRTYKSLRFFMSYHLSRAMWAGWRGWLWLVPLQAAGLSFSEDRLSLTGLLASWLLGQPVLTALRRVQCQSPEAGMLPVRYAGVWHALRLIFQEEGFRGLYRGALLEGMYRGGVLGCWVLARVVYNRALESGD
jgi:hypothetical protein